MGSVSPAPWMIFPLVALLFLVGYGQIRSRLWAGARPKRASGPVRRRFFEGMNTTNALALAGALLMALALLVDVYGPDWAPGAWGEPVSLALAGSGGILTLLSFFVARRSGGRGG